MKEDTTATLPAAYAGEVIRALQTVGLALRSEQRRLSRQLGLSLTELQALQLLHQAGRMTGSELAHATGLTPSTLTGVINRLEERGLVERQRSRADRRKILLATTPQALDQFQAVPTDLLDRFTDRFDMLPHWEQTMILASLSRLSWLMQDLAPEGGADTASEGGTHARSERPDARATRHPGGTGAAKHSTDSHGVLAREPDPNSPDDSQDQGDSQDQE